MNPRPGPKLPFDWDRAYRCLVAREAGESLKDIAAREGISKAWVDVSITRARQSRGEDRPSVERWIVESATPSEAIVYCDQGDLRVRCKVQGWHVIEVHVQLNLKPTVRIESGALRGISIRGADNAGYHAQSKLGRH